MDWIMTTIGYIFTILVIVGLVYSIFMLGYYIGNVKGYFERMKQEEELEKAKEKFEKDIEEKFNNFYKVKHTK